MPANNQKKLFFAKYVEPTSCKKLPKKSGETFANAKKSITFAPALKHCSLLLLD
jgi:hypothetical protein